MVPDPTAIPTALLRPSIDAGERSAIALAIEREATLLLDDRRARRIAAESGRPVIGTLGLLVLAREEGFVADLRPLIEQLPLKPIPIKERLSVLYIKKGNLDVLDGAFVIVDKTDTRTHVQRDRLRRRNPHAGTDGGEDQGRLRQVGPRGEGSEHQG